MLELDIHLIRWRSSGNEPAEKLRSAAAARAGLERIGLIRISIARRMESPDGTYMSHYGAPVGCQGASLGSAGGSCFPVFSPTRDQDLEWAGRCPLGTSCTIKDHRRKARQNERLDEDLYAREWA